jgi:hypothetical protein
MAEPKLTLGVGELAARMGTSPRALSRWLRKQGVPLEDIGNESRVWLSDLFEKVPKLRQSQLIARELGVVEET